MLKEINILSNIADFDQTKILKITSLILQILRINFDVFNKT